jgi:hypothetical protein
LTTFDPYHEWLQIPPDQRPIDHYRLLGLARFEDDADRIARAADERMALVSSFQVGPRKVQTQRLLNELSAARLCLLSPTAKADYDATLRSVDVSPAPPPLVEPPIQPPPPTETSDAAAVTSPSRWRPFAALVTLALVPLAAAAAWSIVQATGRPPGSAATTDAPPPPIVTPPKDPAPVIQLQEANGEVNLGPATAELHGGATLRNSGAGEVLAGFGGTDSQAQWNFRLVEPGFFHLELVYATAAETSGAALVVSLGQERKECELRSTGGKDQFLTDTFTIAIPKSGQYTLVLWPEGQPASDWLKLRSVRLVPIGRE